MNITVRGLLQTAFLFSLLAGVSAVAQDTNPVQGNAGQASQPAGVADGPGGKQGTNPSPGSEVPAAKTPSEQTSTAKPATTTDDNPFDPVLEVPPLPKGKPTLVGGIATHVDPVRERLTISPFGGGKKLRLFMDERSHIYRDGTETTVTDIHNGDRVYADTMLDGAKVFAKNVRVITRAGLAEVRGQVVGTNPSKGTISVNDQLSAKPVTFTVNNLTHYSSRKGPAGAGDVQPGALIDVQFSPDNANRDIAEEIMVLARPGDDYMFAGVVTHLDMRSDTLALENQSDQLTYELHFDPAALPDARALKVGSDITAHAVFDGKQYKANNVRIENAKPTEGGEQSKAQ